jgi:tRNA (cmo5U34)-methyltransferase
MGDAQRAGSWSEDNSRQFVDYGRYFVPDRERQIGIIGDLIPPPGGALLVELCSGEGLLSRALLERFPSCRMLALDGSPEMRARTAATSRAHAARLTVAAFDLAARDWRAFAEPPHAIVSSLAIHHLDGGEKRTLFRDLAGALAPGGALVIADIVRPPDARGLALAAQQWDENVRERVQALDGDPAIIEEFGRLRWNYFRDPDGDPIDKPSSLAEQLAWMTEAGFTGVDCHWLLAGHAIFSGRKA